MPAVWSPKNLPSKTEKAWRLQMLTIFVSINLLLKPNIFHAGARLNWSVGLQGEKNQAIICVMKTKQIACVTMAQ